MKKLTIEITDEGDTSSFEMRTNGMQKYEVMGILRTALLLQEHELISQNETLRDS